jgi:uncharacterized membrane protein
LKQKQTNPLVIAVFGLMLLVFGIVDYLNVNQLLGIVLSLVGIYLGVTGINRYKVLKRQLQQKKSGSAE